MAWSATSTRFLNPSRGGDSTTALGSLVQCLTMILWFYYSMILRFCSILQLYPYVHHLKLEVLFQHHCGQSLGQCMQLNRASSIQNPSVASSAKSQLQIGFQQLLTQIKELQLARTGHYFLLDNFNRWLWELFQFFSTNSLLFWQNLEDPNCKLQKSIQNSVRFSSSSLIYGFTFSLFSPDHIGKRKENKKKQRQERRVANVSAGWWLSTAWELTPNTRVISTPDSARACLLLCATMQPCWLAFKLLQQPAPSWDSSAVCLSSDWSTFPFIGPRTEEKPDQEKDRSVLAPLR